MNAFAIELFCIIFFAGVYLLHPGSEQTSNAAIATPATPEVEPAPAPIAKIQVEQKPEAVEPIAAAAPVASTKPKPARGKGFAKRSRQVANINPTALRQRCTRQGIKWWDAHSKGQHLSREEMLQALQQVQAA